MLLRITAVVGFGLLLSLAFFGSFGVPVTSGKAAAQTKGSTDGLWRENDLRTQIAAQANGIRAYRTLSLNRSLLTEMLARAPLEFTATARVNALEITLPLPDGSFRNFRVVESPIMAPELAARFPEIRTYKGQGVDDSSLVTRFDLTPQGFHALVLSSQGTVLIAPASPGDTTNYIAYYQGDVPVGSSSCGVSEAEQEASIARDKEKPATNKAHPEVSSGSALRTYRLAVAATAEYTQQYGGGTVNGGLSAITTTVNQVDLIYEREVSVRLVLIANETAIIFTDTNTDGYTSDDVNSLINQNQVKLDTVIGDANYDIGHVFDGRAAPPGFFSFQGLAGIGVVCRSGQKARGVSITRSVTPANVVAYYSTSHEMGHQFSATHTFNANTGSCLSARSPATAYEPGTGTTIMGYRFTCAPEDFMSSDTYFHGASLEQIVNYTTIGSGSSCPVTTSTGNHAPTVLALQNYTIPRSTPFTLTALAADPDDDSILYSWEEFDLGAAAPPDTDDGSRPIFRSFAPANVPSRTFPRLFDILNGTQTFGESLPTTTRTLNFRITARDYSSNQGNGGVSSATMQVNVRADSGPFAVTQPTSSTSWPNNSDQTVTWNVANTNQAPVSCSTVQIGMSTDGGNTYPIVLANETPNDGSETVRLSGLTLASACIRVQCKGNIFFNLSPGFAITGPNSPLPTMSGFSPGSGVPGTSVTITGTNFLPIVGVTFNDIPATFVQNSTTELVAIVPAGATTGQLRVTTSQGTVVGASNFVVTQPANTIQFTAANFAGGEGCTATTINVIRTGDTSVTSTVDFVSADAGAVQTADYSVASGTITFAPGETSKSFGVITSEDAYVEGNETLGLTLSNVTGGTLGTPSTATVTIGDNDSVNPPVTQPIDDTATFVCQHYHDFLSREPDPAGQAFWISQITACGNDPVCIHSKRVDVSNAFFYELEFQQTGSYVYRVYRAAFGNHQPFPNPFPDPHFPKEDRKLPEYLRFMKDRAQVSGGPQLAQFQLSFADAFVERPEFTSAYPAALDGPGFVDAMLLTMLNDLGVNLTAQRQALIDLYNQGGRGNVLYRLADDNVQTNPLDNRAFIDAEYNRAFVFTQYAGYLRRNPDVGGFLFWLGKVNGAPIRDVPQQHAMVCSFITSGEYQQRFSSVVSHSNTECPQ
jgi:Metallo-peptidase family M12/Calx-beta domain